jgi:hypothetical protein
MQRHMAGVIASGNGSVNGNDSGIVLCAAPLDASALVADVKLHRQLPGSALSHTNILPSSSSASSSSASTSATSTSASSSAAAAAETARLLGNVDHHAAAAPLRAAFEQLSAALKAAPGLPLTIVGIQPVHAAFRHAAVWVPAPVDLAASAAAALDALDPLGALHFAPAQDDEEDDNDEDDQAGNGNGNGNGLGVSRRLNALHVRARFALEPIPVVLQFESSGKWPNEVAAIARLKTAFYLRIAQGMGV